MNENRPDKHEENTADTGKSTAVPSKFQAGWLDSLDGRLSLARGLRARYQELTDDLGGASNMSYQRRTLAERCIWLEFWLAEQERELAHGGEFNPGQWVQACNALSGLFKTLGLDRAAKDVPDLQTWMKERGKG